MSSEGEFRGYLSTKGLCVICGVMPWTKRRVTGQEPVLANPNPEKKSPDPMLGQAKQGLYMTCGQGTSFRAWGGVNERAEGTGRGKEGGASSLD